MLHQIPLNPRAITALQQDGFATTPLCNFFMKIVENIEVNFEQGLYPTLSRTSALVALYSHL